MLRWTEIECNVCTLDALQTELAEIDENVVRTELSVIEYGELLERRKEIYESLHPETKAGQAQAAGMNRAIGNNVSDKMSVTLKPFSQDTAGKLGVSPRTIEWTIQMMNGLTEDTREVFRHYPQYKLSQSNAMKLSHMEPGKQKQPPFCWPPVRFDLRTIISPWRYALLLDTRNHLGNKKLIFGRASQN